MTFDDVISQQHITDTLRHQVISGKTAHAYLFTGSRGTGKTTCARILAKAVNCEHTHDGNPCLECEMCRDADSGALTDIVEIDAASNNGVDDIRDLRDGAVYTPERGKFKIYIIDEVHMLSVSAFNALLKIMEEPPEYVKFILATTEVHKVPATVLSRCQRYDFRRIRSEDIASRLKYIAEQEGFTLTDDGAALIAGLADGGMRDAVSLLDRCSVGGEVIDSDTVSAAAGIAGRGYLYDMLEAVFADDTAKALSIAAELHDMSKDLVRLCEELITQMRNVMLLKVSPETAESLIVCMPDELDRLRKLAAGAELDTVIERLDLLQICRERMGRVLNRRVEFEMSLIKLCGKLQNNSTQTIDNSEIYDKIKQLEDKLGSGMSAATAKTSNPSYERKADSPMATEEPRPNVDLKKARPEDIKPLTQWDAILEEFSRVNPACAGSLKDSHAGIIGNVVLIVAKNQFFMDLFRQRYNAQTLGDAIERVLGFRYALRAKCDTTPQQQRSMAAELIKKAIDSQIETAVDNNQ